MSLKSLTTEQLNHERAEVENRLNKAEWDLWQDRDTLRGPSLSQEWAVRRFRNELHNITTELESRHV